MSKWVFNNSGAQKTYIGKVVNDQAYLEIELEDYNAAKEDELLITDVAAANSIMSTLNGVGGHLDVVRGMQFLLDQLAESRDGDGSLFVRPKATALGWTYQFESIEVTTAKHGTTGLFNANKDGADLGHSTITIYDNLGAEITDPANEGNAVRTQLDWMPNYDFELLGGQLKQDIPPTQDVRLYATVAPDFMGGAFAIDYMYGGLNLKHVSQGNQLNVDGRAAKLLPYNSGAGTNLVRFILTHPAGVQHNFGLIIEHFKE